MLKFTKGLFVVMGLAAAVTAVTFMFQVFSRVDHLVATAQAGAGTAVSDPRTQIWVAVAAAALTGLCLGIGVALPRRTARSIRNETRAQIAAAVPAATPASDVSAEE